MGDEVLLVIAEEAGEVVAAALNLIGSHCIYGRNWGCRADKDYKYLHFELCYYQVGAGLRLAADTDHEAMVAWT